MFGLSNFPWAMDSRCAKYFPILFVLNVPPVRLPLGTEGHRLLLTDWV